MPNQPPLPPPIDAEAQAIRVELFALAQQLGQASTASAARLSATFIWLQERLIRHLRPSARHLEDALRDYDPIRANQVEDGALRLEALLQRLTPRFSELSNLEDATLSRERYSLYLDWNLLLAEYLVYLDLQARVKPLTTESEPLQSAWLRSNSMAYCRERVRQHNACT